MRNDFHTVASAVFESFLTTVLSLKKSIFFQFGNKNGYTLSKKHASNENFNTDTNQNKTTQNDCFIAQFCTEFFA